LAIFTEFSKLPNHPSFPLYGIIICIITMILLPPHVHVHVHVSYTMWKPDMQYREFITKLISTPIWLAGCTALMESLLVTSFLKTTWSHSAGSYSRYVITYGINLLMTRHYTYNGCADTCTFSV
jgi:hypothetical protein